MLLLLCSSLVEGSGLRVQGLQIQSMPSFVLKSVIFTKNTL